MIKIDTLLRNTVLVLALFATSTYLHAAGTESKAEAELHNIDGSEHRFELAKQYYGQCISADGEQFAQIQPYLRNFTDMEVMAETMADPVKFMQLMSVVNDPHTIHVMSKCASEPVMWDTWMKGMTDFNKMGRIMTRMMNPNMVFAWMTASMNPATYEPFAKMSNPAYYNKWMTAMMNPTFYQPMTSLADPNWYTPRMQWMMNPQSMQPITNMMNMSVLPQARKATTQAIE